METQHQNTNQEKQTISIEVPTVENIASRRSYIPALFALAIIFFFFTFCEFRCGGEKIGSVTGFNLVTGTELFDSESMDEAEKVPANIWAILALAAGIVGLGVYLIKDKREALIGTGAGAIGFGSLLILQFAIKHALQKNAEVAIDTVFKFGYWGALIAMLIAGIISYLRMKQMSRIGTDLPQHQPALAADTDRNNPVQTTTPPSFHAGPSSEGFDVLGWLKTNMRIVAGVLAVLLILVLVYFFFLKHNPLKDAKRISAAYCDCTEQYYEGLIGIKDNYINNFSSFNFQKRFEARDKLVELQKPVEAAYAECNNRVNAKYSKLRERFISDEANLEKFDLMYNELQENCNPPNQAKMFETSNEIEGIISSVKDPGPDIEEIKADLIGETVPGWQFDALSEIQKATIVKATYGSDMLEYIIDLKLSGINNPETDIHDAQILVTYYLDDEGWYFDDLREIYITYTNRAEVGQWKRVVPLRGCSYEIFDNGKRYWIQDGSNGPKYQGGPDRDPFTLHSTEIFLMSREEEAIDLIFKYTPMDN